MINIIIFRVPDDELGQTLFVEVPYKDGKLADVGTTFRVAEDDSYNSMGFNTIVLAEKTAEGSTSFCSFELGEDNDHAYFVYRMSADAIEGIVAEVISQISVPDDVSDLTPGFVEVDVANLF